MKRKTESRSTESRWLRRGVWLWTFWFGALLAGSAAAQTPMILDERCTVTVGNQTAIVHPDGSFTVPNISVFTSRTTGVAPQLYRVRATCLINGEALTGQSDFFSLIPGQTTVVADVFPSALDPIPTRIEVTSPADFLPQGSTTQLVVTGFLPDGGTEDISGRLQGTTFLSTNPALLTVSEDGLVTGVNATTTPQTVLIAALNEGNIATVSITAVGGSNDFDNDGMPNDYEDLFGLNKFANDANADLDSDGLTNLQEFELGTLPNNPDTDADGIIDGLDGDPLHPEEGPPTVAIITPADGATLVEGQGLQFTVDATDDGLLTSVQLSTDTGLNATLSSPPFVLDLTVPLGITQMVFTATATDSVGNVSVATSTADVIPDPLTTVVGVVLDPDALPVEGATVTVNPGISGTTAADGSFSISNVPTVFGDIVANARFEAPPDPVLFGSSDPFPPVLGGVTDVGVIRLVGKLSLLIVAADTIGPPVAELEASEVFSSIDVFFSQSGTPTLAELTAHNVVLVYTNNIPQNKTLLGDRLADYVDAGGGLVICTYSFSSPWNVAGRIATPGYAPLVNVGSNGFVSGILVPLVPSDPIFADVDMPALRYFRNSNFAHPGLDPGATLIATEGTWNMIARNAAGNVIGLNLFPACCNFGGNNAELYKLIANALRSAFTGIPTP